MSAKKGWSWLESHETRVYLKLNINMISRESSAYFQSTGNKSDALHKDKMLPSKAKVIKPHCTSSSFNVWGQTISDYFFYSWMFSLPAANLPLFPDKFYREDWKQNNLACMTVMVIYNHHKMARQGYNAHKWLSQFVALSNSLKVLVSLELYRTLAKGATQ